MGQERKKEEDQSGKVEGGEIYGKIYDGVTPQRAFIHPDHFIKRTTCLTAMGIVLDNPVWCRLLINYNVHM